MRTSFRLPHPIRARMRAPVVYWSVVGLTALLTAGVVQHLLAAAERGADIFGDPRPVPVARTDIPAGVEVTDDMVELRDLPGHLVPPGAADRSPVGRWTAAHIVGGEVVIEARLAGSATSPTSGALPPGTVGMTVPRDGTTVPLHPGDRVDVLHADPLGMGAETVGLDVTVVTVGPETAVVAVPEDEAEPFAAAIAGGRIVLALRGSG